MEQVYIERIMNVIARTQKISRENITLEDSLESLGIDSFDGINLLFALEDEFDIQIPDEKQDLKYVRDIVNNLAILLHKTN